MPFKLLEGLVSAGRKFLGIEASHAVLDDAPKPPTSGWGDAINVPLARDRMMEHFEREQLPGDVKSTLAAALNGDLRYQALLFNAMLDTWPKLQKGISKLGEKVVCAPWKLDAYAPRGGDPSTKDQEIARKMEEMLWGMTPRPDRMEHGLEDMIRSLVRGYFYGHVVEEVRWMQDPVTKSWRPRCTKTVPPRFYGYPTEIGEDDEDRLKYDPTGYNGKYEDFAPNRFLIGVHVGHSGHPSTAAPLRALASYWLAAVYGLKWFCHFSQLYGIPWRHAEIDDESERAKVEGALSSIGANGYIVTKTGTKIHILESPSSGQNLPQKALLEMADQQCDVFILGQTLTSGTDDSGSRALGEVHEKTESDVEAGICDFVGSIITHQLIPSIYEVNWRQKKIGGLPQFWAKKEESKDLDKATDRLAKAQEMGVRIGRQFAHDELGIPLPADGEDVLEKSSRPSGYGPEGEPQAGESTTPHETEPKAGIQAADASSQLSGSLGIPRAEMPQIERGNRSAMVSFLKAKGAVVEKAEVKAGDLKPSQSNYSAEKVTSMRKAIQAGEFKVARLLISEDMRLLDGHHQWLALKEEKPQDTIPVFKVRLPAPRALMLLHRMPSSMVQAADASLPEERLGPDALAEAVLEGLTGVAYEWLTPVRPVFERLAALAQAKQVTDDDFLAALEKAQEQLPEVFDLMDTAALERAFENAIGSGMLAGSLSASDA